MYLQMNRQSLIMAKGETGKHAFRLPTHVKKATSEICYHLAINIAVLALLCLSFVPASQAAEKLGLKEAVSTAIKGNPDLSALNARFDAFKNIPSQEASLPDPILSFNALNLPVDTFSLDQEAMTQMQVKLTQKVPFPGKLSLKETAAIKERDGLRYRIEELKQTIASRVAQEWWELFYLAKAISIVETNQKYLQEMVEVARSRYEVGKGLQPDVLLAQVELTNLFNLQAELRGRSEETSSRLARLMGMADHSIPDIDLSCKVSLPAPPDVSRLVKRAKAKRPLLMEKEKQVEAAQARLELARKGYMPDFTLGAAYGFRQDAPQGMERPDFASFMVAVNIPIWAGSKQSRRISQKDMELAEKRRLYQSAVEQMWQQISGAAAIYKSNYRQSALYRDAVIPQARQTLASMLAAYQVGKVDFLNVIRARLALLKYERRYWRSVTNAMKALARIRAASGTYEDI
ncbi:MAG: transporter [Thermodesulfatator sp.]|nr:MAG: transporter [Thermodesulfatator sp.]